MSAALLTETDSAAERVLRIFARFVAAGYVFYLGLLLPDIARGTQVTAWWWTPVALIAVYGTGFALGVASFGGAERRLRLLASAAAAGYLVAVLLWWPAWNGGQLAELRGMWFSQFNGLASLAAAAAWRPRWAVAHLVAGAVVVQTINYLARSGQSDLLPEIAWSIGFCLLPVSAGIMAVRTGRILDETRAETYAAAAAAAAATARTVERARFDALTHDGVMATLLSAARQPMNRLLSTQAASTMAKLDTFRAGGDPATEFDVPELVSHLRVAVNEVNDRVGVESVIAGDAGDARFPAEAARAVAGGMAEALRNSYRHAGPDVERWVVLHVTGDGFRATVGDTGCGFEPAAVPANRLGIAVSIVRQLNELPGGTAAIETAPGAGTRVHLSWSRAA
ncbi:sensor histidine kinase [Nocardia harenae]|uniref:sensor histidine kinase n=1 Tax=Nocardia harenae TaxID=358707 RepID=UPI00082C8DD2|nr:ATP-binding protein [Nocardia harenae]